MTRPRQGGTAMHHRGDVVGPLLGDGTSQRLPDPGRALSAAQGNPAVSKKAALLALVMILAAAGLALAQEARHSEHTFAEWQQQLRSPLAVERIRALEALASFGHP